MVLLRTLTVREKKQAEGMWTQGRSVLLFSYSFRKEGLVLVAQLQSDSL